MIHRINTENARLCNYCSNPECPYSSDELFKQKVNSDPDWIITKPCWQPFKENIGKVHDENGNFI